MVLYLITAYMIDIYTYIYFKSHKDVLLSIRPKYFALRWLNYFTINKTVDLLALPLSKTFGGEQIQII